jgi:Leucine-rich repeat (LRR) protein
VPPYTSSLITTELCDNLTNYPIKLLLRTFPFTVFLTFNFYQLKSFTFDDSMIQLMSFSLTNSGLESFRSNLTVENVSQISCLHLSKNNLTSLDDDAFKGMENLKYLLLHMNKLSTVNSEIFKYLKYLLILVLHDNDIKSLDLKFYQMLPKSMTILFMSQNELTEIPANAFDNFPNLTELELACNYLKSFEISNVKLEILDLSGNEISEFNLGNSSSITSLFLDENNLTVLSSAMMSKIPKLKEFSFENNSIDRIDRSLMKKFENVKNYKENFLYNPCVNETDDEIDMKNCFENFEKT